jgi:hypothetical protein
MSARRCRLRGSRRGAHSDSCVGILRLAIFWNHWARQGAGETFLPLSLSYFLSLFSLPLLRPRSLGIAAPPVSSLLYIHRLVFFCSPTSTVLSSFTGTSLEKVADTQVQSQTHMYGSDSAQIRTRWYPIPVLYGSTDRSTRLPVVPRNELLMMVGDDGPMPGPLARKPTRWQEFTFHHQGYMCNQI